MGRRAFPRIDSRCTTRSPWPEAGGQNLLNFLLCLPRQRRRVYGNSSGQAVEALREPGCHGEEERTGIAEITKVAKSHFGSAPADMATGGFFWFNPYPVP
jgi:hypothetical protein